MTACIGQFTIEMTIKSFGPWGPLVDGDKMGLFNQISRIWKWRTDEFTDMRLREKFKQKYQITVGLYSYGCFDRHRIDPNTHIGRYCSFAKTAHVFNRNHGIDFLSSTPFLYNSRLGLVEKDTFDYLSCYIEDDVWVGHNGVITASARRIGRGAIIAAGAVVTEDVAPYTIVAGVPARVLRRRFSASVIEKIEASRWWEWDLTELHKRVKYEPDMLFRPAKYFE